MNRLSDMPSMPTPPAKLEPGDVLVERLCGVKLRPWLILWVDDELGAMCVVALSSKSAYLGCCETGDARFPTAGAIVSIQPMLQHWYYAVVHKTDPAARRRVAEHMQKTLDLRGSYDGTP